METGNKDEDLLIWLMTSKDGRILHGIAKRATDYGYMETETAGTYDTPSFSFPNSLASQKSA